MEKIQIRTGMNISNLILRSYQFFGLKILNFFYVGPDPGSCQPCIRDPGWKRSDPGYGINIPDPQHCIKAFVKPPVKRTICKFSLCTYTTSGRGKNTAESNHWQRRFQKEFSELVSNILEAIGKKRMPIFRKTKPANKFPMPQQYIYLARQSL